MAAAAATMMFPTMWGTVDRSIRVLIVNGQGLVREGLAALVDRETDMTVVGAASTAEEALDEVRRHRPDVVILALSLPDMPGEQLALRIAEESPRVRIVAIASSQGHVAARRALDAGVHGYIQQAAPAKDLVRAIRQVQAGKRMIPGPALVRAQVLEMQHA